MSKGLYFDPNREEAFRIKVRDFEQRARDLQRDIAAEQFAPNMSVLLGQAMGTVADYFGHLGKHADHNLAPPHFRPSRSRR